VWRRDKIAEQVGLVNVRLFPAVAMLGNCHLLSSLSRLEHGYLKKTVWQLTNPFLGLIVLLPCARMSWHDPHSLKKLL
jgi:hypothetical protein